MAVIETKFDIGDVVFHATTEGERRRHACPDCAGTRKWRAVSPAGGEYEVDCPRCSQVYMSNRALSLDYSVFAPRARKLTIGSVKANTDRGDSYDSGNTYMCLETGVGSGSVYREADLFSTEAEALSRATSDAAAKNADPDGWVAKQYAETIVFSDYQLKDAAVEAAEARTRCVSIRHQMLVEDIREAEDMGDVRRIVEALDRQPEAA